MERDKDSIGLTPENQRTLADLEKIGWFKEGQDIARLALALAVRAGHPSGVTADTETRWTAGLFDKTGEIRVVLAALYPECRTPVRLMEHLVNEGLKLLAARVKSGSVAPDDLIG
jgi:hypothetical protein